MDTQVTRQRSGTGRPSVEGDGPVRRPCPNHRNKSDRKENARQSQLCSMPASPSRRASPEEQGSAGASLPKSACRGGYDEADRPAAAASPRGIELTMPFSEPWLFMPRVGSCFTAASFVRDLRPEPELAAPLPLGRGKITVSRDPMIQAVTGELSAKVSPMTTIQNETIMDWSPRSRTSNPRSRSPAVIPRHLDSG